MQGKRPGGFPPRVERVCAMGVPRTIPQEAGHESVELRVSPHAPGQARRWVSEQGSDLPRGTLDLLLILVSELVTNSVRHSGAVPGERLQIALERGGGTIHVDVQDTGPGFDRRNLAPGPHGLQVVESAADRWGIDRSGPTTVWFELDVA
jgi:anti-sigma regulatory factor (Ser/Thr protein kinase)